MSTGKETQSLLNKSCSANGYHSACTDNLNQFSVNDSTFHVNERIDENSKRPGLSIPQAIFLMINATLGGGLLNFPRAYADVGGVVQGLIFQTIFSVLAYGSLAILTYCQHISGTRSYEETVLVFCGSVMQVVSQMLLVFHSFGSSITYLVLIDTNISAWYFDRKFLIIVIPSIFILPLCIPKKLNIIGFSSVFGGCAAFLISMTILLQYYLQKYTYESPPSPYVWSNAQAALPVICFGLQAHIPSVSVFSEIRYSSLKRCSFVILMSTTVCYAVYAVAGACGYLTFGYAVKSDILLNYDPKDNFATIPRACIALNVFTTYAIYQFVGRSAAIGLWAKLRHLTQANIDNGKIRRRLFTIFWFFSSVGLALLFPDIGKAIHFFGGLAAHFMFTFPGLFLVQSILKFDTSNSKLKSIGGFAIGAFYVVLGVAIFSQSLCYAIKEEIDG